MSNDNCRAGACLGLCSAVAINIPVGTSWPVLVVKDQAYVALKRFVRVATAFY